MPWNRQPSSAHRPTIDAAGVDTFPLGDAIEAFIRREDAERFVEQVRDERELACHLRIGERELEAGGLN